MAEEAGRALWERLEAHHKAGYLSLHMPGHKENAALAPYLARQQLLRDDGGVAIIDGFGNYLPGEEEREAAGAPPPEGRVFLNAGASLRGLMEEIHQFFQKEEFDTDFQHSLVLYEQALGILELEEECGEDFWRGYWDYFLFDYHLLEEDVTPLEIFRRTGSSAYPQLVNELSQGFLALFTIEEVLDENRFVCRDFLTGELYYLSFPLTGTDPLEDRVFLGHVFYNRSMGMNWLQSYTLKPLARKRLLEVLEACRDWYDVQFPGADWGEFLSRQALVCREVLRKVSKNPAACRFPYETRHRDYVPGPLPEKMTPVEKMVQEIVLVSGRGEYDIRLIRHMWADFKDLCPHTGLYEPQVWAAALVENFLEINDKRAARQKPFLLETFGVPHRDLTRAYMEIRNQLKLEPSCSGSSKRRVRISTS